MSATEETNVLPGSLSSRFPDPSLGHDLWGDRDRRDPDLCPLLRPFSFLSASEHRLLGVYRGATRQGGQNTG